MLSTFTKRVAAAGVAVWLILLLIRTSDSPETELIHKVLFFAVLVVVPLGLSIVAPHDRVNSVFYRLAVYTQPVAALVTIASFFFEKGVVSAALSSAWLIVTILIALYGLTRLVSRRLNPLEELSIDAGLLYLPVAGMWLVVYRLGVQPFGYGETIILLTAVHFHFAGFATPIIAGMSGRVLARGHYPRKIFVVVVFAVIAAMPLVAAGITFSPWLGFFGSLLLAAGLALLAVLTIGWVRRTITTVVWRMLLVIGALSSCVAMVLACLFAYSVASHTLILTIPTMAMTHGLLNAFGFVTCSLVAWSQIAPEESGRKEAQKARIAASAVIVSALLLMALCPSSLRAQTKPDKDYLVYVLSEGADKIALIRFGPAGARIEHQLETGDMPVDIDGPHGIVLSPDRQFYYVTIAHGRPFGSVWKYSTKDNAVIGKASLGYFPATLDVSREGDFLFVVNFNLHGDMVPSTVSVVSTQTMTEIARIQTCTMPHGSRLNPQGTKQYSACMMDDMLVEIDTRTLKASRHFIVTKNQEKGLNGPPQTRSTHSMHAGAGHGSEPPKPGDQSCSPTWAEPSADGSSIFVACNASSEIVEVNANTWTLVRRMPARPGVYNLEVTHDGSRLLATNKRDQSVSIYDLKSGKEVVRLPTKRKVLHGVVVSPDDRYAFVTVEGVGSEPGTVEIIDLVAMKTVATVDVAQGAAGIDFYR